MTASSEPAACDACGSHRAPMTVVTTDATGHVVHRQICTGCARDLPPVRMCVRCQAFTTAPVLVSEVHAGSGPGFNVYACAPCAPLCPTPPDAAELLEVGFRERADEGKRPR
ncbi:hypothetical protein QCN29_00555 [Streptomyces sp. HNM0663]|uniref:Uncharacterized protein n=1 Tax=Streptomyces chengmaiensis TaxID=3040919 RepID=A0ABT6HEW4_9ACTN|nr:hypothetical protein [Streptomyces chengmaiensis]MDH2387300.1 hypothetical protein [Streptomyces chengmaiensis]